MIRPSGGCISKFIQIRDLKVELVRKSVKHLRIRICPPDARVSVTAPIRVSERSVAQEVLARLGWIHEAQKKVLSRSQAMQCDFVSGEIHLFLGQRYVLNVLRREGEGAGSVRLRDASSLELLVPETSARVDRSAALQGWYREQLMRILPPLIEKWSVRLGVQVREWRVRRMRTRWGSCNHRAGRIWLSLELAKQSIPCIEYVVVHELAHLIEPNHGPRFKQILSGALPGWKVLDQELKRFAMGSE